MTPSVSKSLRFTGGKTFSDRNQMRQFEKLYSGSGRTKSGQQLPEEIKHISDKKEKEKEQPLSDIQPKKNPSIEETVKEPEIE